MRRLADGLAGLVLLAVALIALASPLAGALHTLAIPVVVGVVLVCVVRVVWHYTSL